MATPDPTTPNAAAGPERRLRFATSADLDEDWVRRLPEVTGVARDRDQFVVTGDERMLFSVVSLLAAHDIVPCWLRIGRTTDGDARG